ncbi:hypothetical protein [Funiculus sociatus]|nr:hypothetical protein [Trichocoleus sp. FACHB-69]
MQLEFVPVEEFYFALTLAVKTLLDLEKPDLTEQVRSRLALKCGQPSTVAAASQNTFNYVFRVQGIDNSPASALIVSVSDWQGKLRLSSDYGWTLDSDRKPVRTEHFNQRPEFALKLQHHLQDWLQVPITQ